MRPTGQREVAGHELIMAAAGMRNVRAIQKHTYRATIIGQLDRQDVRQNELRILAISAMSSAYFTVAS